MYVKDKMEKNNILTIKNKNKLNKFIYFSNIINIFSN